MRAETIARRTFWITALAALSGSFEADAKRMHEQIRACDQARRRRHKESTSESVELCRNVTATFPQWKNSIQNILTPSYASS